MEYFIRNKGEVSKQLEGRLGLPFQLGWSETDMLTIREIGEIEKFSVFRAREIEDDLPPIEVVNPGIGEDDVRELSEQLAEILQGEL